jgi:hypothetical protein
VRRLPRSGDCAEFSHETNPPSASNLASHLYKCQGIPPEHTLDTAKARSRPSTELLTPAQVSLGAMFKLCAPVPKPPTALTPSTFRSTLIQGVIRDNYPLTFGEGAGMKQVFSLLNSVVELPSHQTLRRDLDQLSDVLIARVQQLLMVFFCLTLLGYFDSNFLLLGSNISVCCFKRRLDQQELFVLTRRRCYHVHRC